MAYSSVSFGSGVTSARGELAAETWGDEEDEEG